MKLLTLTLALLLMTTTSHAQNVDLEGLNALIEQNDGKKADTWVDSYTVIAKMPIQSNKFGITTDDIIAYKNERGDGWFFFVPQTSFSGIERKFLWYALDDELFKLNGATHHLTPDLPYLKDASDDVLKRAGITDRYNAMEFADALTFEQHAKKNR